jgi:hypothetical protein
MGHVPQRVPSSPGQCNGLCACAVPSAPLRAPRPCHGFKFGKGFVHAAPPVLWREGDVVHNRGGATYPTVARHAPCDALPPRLVACFRVCSDTCGGTRRQASSRRAEGQHHGTRQHYLRCDRSGITRHVLGGRDRVAAHGVHAGCGPPQVRGHSHLPAVSEGGRRQDHEEPHARRLSDNGSCCGGDPPRAPWRHSARHAPRTWPHLDGDDGPGGQRVLRGANLRGAHGALGALSGGGLEHLPPLAEPTGKPQGASHTPAWPIHTWPTSDWSWPSLSRACPGAARRWAYACRCGIGCQPTDAGTCQ